MTDGTGRVPLAPLRTASWWLWTRLAFGGGLMVLLWGLVRYPESRWYAGPLAVLVAGMATAAWTLRRWLEDASPDALGGAGAVVSARFWGRWRRRVVLAQGSSVVLRGAGGTVYLHAEGGGQTVNIDVLAMTGYTRASRDVAGLLALADAVDHREVAGGACAATELRSQAEWLRGGGGELGRSPLAGLRQRVIPRRRSPGS